MAYCQPDITGIGKIDSFESLAKFTADREQTKTATELAYAEVISYNRKNLERELQNESFRMRDDRVTGNRAGLSGERKKSNEI